MLFPLLSYFTDLPPSKMAFAENHQASDEPEWQRNSQESNDLQVFSLEKSKIVRKVELIHISIDTL